jgi:methylmalonyl-CoA mutase
MEFYTFMRSLLDKMGASHIKIFGGGGGVILPGEIRQLKRSGTARTFSPDDGRRMGLQGMVNEVVRTCDFTLKGWNKVTAADVRRRDPQAIARLITAAENNPGQPDKLLRSMGLKCPDGKPPVVGITGTGGSGKSSLVDELIRRYLNDHPRHTVGIISVDPTKRRSGGALLGDRIRMNAIRSRRVFMRSMATRRADYALSGHVKGALCILKAAGFNLVLLETSGIGQASSEVTEYCDVPVYVMTPEYGAATQLEKIDMLDFADLVVLNKSDRPGAADALRDVRKQYKRSRGHFAGDPSTMPVYSTVASDFNDPGIEKLYSGLLKLLAGKTGKKYRPVGERRKEFFHRTEIIPGKRIRYLSEIGEMIANTGKWIDEQAEIANHLYGLRKSIEMLEDRDNSPAASELKKLAGDLEKNLDPDNLRIIRGVFFRFVVVNVVPVVSP